MKLKIVLVLSLAYTVCSGQTRANFVLRGNFSREDSVHIVSSYMQAQQAVDKMYSAMNAIWNAAPLAGQTKKTLRA